LNFFLNGDNANSSSYYRLLSAAAQHIWRSETDKPLKVVVGESRPAIGIAVYSPDHPDVNPLYPMSVQPTGAIASIDVNSEKIRRSGMITVCRGTVSECGSFMRTFSPSAIPERLQEVTLSRRFLGWTGAPQTFTIGVIPPGSRIRAPEDLP
jgi:hypothetical protein